MDKDNLSFNNKIIYHETIKESGHSSNISKLNQVSLKDSNMYNSNLTSSNNNSSSSLDNSSSNTQALKCQVLSNYNNN